MDKITTKLLGAEFFDFSPEQVDYFKLNNARKSGYLSEFATKYTDAVYYDNRSIRTKMEYSNPFITDCDRILNNPFYNRYTDKTQVFSFYRNDDITRRGLHVQLVSRIARTIGNALNLNLDLIEAIALGHDLGHTPFGHLGETYLSELYYSHVKRYFNHNAHSFRILHTLSNKDARHGLTLQTLDGILCHNGEKVREQYAPEPTSKRHLLESLELCYTSRTGIESLKPCTLEGCVVRVSDIIAYIGKDRQDLIKAGRAALYHDLPENPLGRSNPDIMPRLIRNIIKNSIGKPYIGFSTEVYQALDSLKADNYTVIYTPNSETAPKYAAVREMMSKLYELFLNDIATNNISSSVFKHHIDSKLISYPANADANDIVTDYIASMTDDYFIDIYKHYFGDDKLSKAIVYIPYEYDL